MTHKQRVVHGRVASEHVVQFFDSLDTRVRSVARFVGHALGAGDGVLVVATSVHWAAVAGELRGLGIDSESLMDSGRLAVADAHLLLAELMRRGSPDPHAFKTLIGRRVRQLAGSHGHVSAYGELVDVLATEREFDAAARLEQLWNQLAEEVSMRLLCGYSAAHFVEGGKHRLKEVCRAHSHVHAQPSDPLGAWLLRLARLPFDPEPAAAQ